METVFGLIYLVMETVFGLIYLIENFEDFEDF